MHARIPAENLSHWYHLFPGLGLTPKEFYDELGGRIAAAQLPGVQICPVDFAEGGALSARRVYLRVMRGDLVYDVCGAPFGPNVFFSSCRLGRSGFSGCMMALFTVLVMVPVAGRLVERLFRPMTYYEADTALMFRDTVHSILTAYLDELAGTHGIAPLTEQQRAMASRPLVNFD